MLSGRISAGALFLAVIASSQFISAQKLSAPDLQLMNVMLSEVSVDVKKNYFDANLHGLDWDALVRETRQSFAKAPDGRTADAEIESLLERLGDSQTFLIPPRDTVSVDYGWKFQIFGKRALVTEVDPHSDAAAKGMQVGDEVLTINGFTVDRTSTPRMKYSMNVLTPLHSLQLDLRDPAGKIHQVNLTSLIKTEPIVPYFGHDYLFYEEAAAGEEKDWQRLKPVYREFKEELMILRIPAFLDTTIDAKSQMEKARRYRSLVLDLRGASGGSMDTLQEYLAGVFDHDVNIGRIVMRNKTNPLVVKGSHRAFQGNLIVLIDSQSTEAAEIFARIVQLEKRGIVVGDRSGGQLKLSHFIWHMEGTFDRVHSYQYATSVSIGDIVLADGKSLEGTGVEPDKIYLPTPADLAAGRDPLMSYAAGLAGVNLSPEDAATWFPRPPER